MAKERTTRNIGVQMKLEMIEELDKMGKEDVRTRSDMIRYLIIKEIKERKRAINAN